MYVNPSHFPDQCCYPCAKLLHHYNLQKYSLVIGSLGFRQYFTIYLIYPAIFMVHATDNDANNTDGF